MALSPSGSRRPAFRDLPPYQTVLDAVKILCNTKPELDVYALSAYMPENPYAVHEKNAWLDAYLPEIDSEHRIFVACGSSKARAAANRLKTPCIDNSFVLLDDYSVNLHEWKANRGSCIKLESIRKEYPAGTRVRLVKMDDIQAPPLGTEGTVVGVDDTGSLLMHWDNGSHLNIVYGSDEVEKV